MTYYVKSTLSVAIAFGASLLLSSCGGDEVEKETFVKKGETNQKITYCMPGTFSSMDPGSSSIAIDSVNMSMVYDGLVGFKKEQAMVEPRLAEKWEVSDDGLEYTFHLRRGVRWQTTKDFTPSRNFNADDVIFSYMRQIDKKSPYYRKKYEMIAGTGVDETIDRIEKVDDYTVKFVLHHPMATFISTQMATYVFGIVSKEYHEKMLKADTLQIAYDHPVGTGPWILTENKDGQYSKFKRHDHYWRTHITPAELTIRVVHDTSKYLDDTEKGNCDITYWINPDDIKKVDQYNNIKLLPQAVLRTWHTQINYTTHPEYKNPLVMQAIAHAINKKTIIEEAFHGQAQIATSLIPSGMFGHIEDGMDYNYSVDRAKELLARSGHQGGKGLKELTYLVRENVSQYSKVASVIQRDLGKIGIKINLVTVPWKELISKIDNHTYEMTGLSWGADFPDPDNFYSSLLGKYDTGTNYPNWHNENYESLRLSSQVTSDQPQRLALYKDITKLYAEHMPIIPLVYSNVAVIVNRGIHGYYVGPIDNSDALTDVYKD